MSVDQKGVGATIKIMDKPPGAAAKSLAMQWIKALDHYNLGVWSADHQSRTIAGTLTKGTKPTVHGLMEAVHWAFAKDMDLRLRPDDLQLAIVQLVAKQVASNPDKYRVIIGIKGDGKETLINVRDDSLISKDDRDDKWSQVISFIGETIASRLTDTPVVRAINTKFTTTTAVDTLVRHVALMEVMNPFTKITLNTKCGIPSVHLDGTAADWQLLIDSLSAYDQLDLQWWTKPVKQVLQHFVAAYDAKSQPDLGFWKSIYKYWSRSGISSCDGWILLFVPTKLDSASLLADEKLWSAHQYCLPVHKLQFGSGISHVPFVWDYCGEKKPMTLAAGFAKPLLRNDAVCSTTAWAVLDK